MKWFRFYVDWLDNPKVQMLDATLQQRYIMLLCLRSMGEIPGMDAKTIAWRLRIEPQDFENSLEILKQNGLWTGKDIPNWDARQYVSDCSTERSRKHRATQKDRCSNDDATLQERPQSQTQNQTQIQTQKKNPPASQGGNVREIIDYLNQVTGRGFSYERGNEFIEKALKRGATVDECKEVIDHCWHEWKDSPKFVGKVNKVTPFRACNFDPYLDEWRAGAAQTGKDAAPAKIQMTEKDKARMARIEAIAEEGRKRWEAENG
jgi:uncharacterized phage protein (TIGR02220 family)